MDRSKQQMLVPAVVLATGIAGVVSASQFFLAQTTGDPSLQQTQPPQEAQTVQPAQPAQTAPAAPEWQPTAPPPPPPPPPTPSPSTGVACAKRVVDTSGQSRWIDAGGLPFGSTCSGSPGTKCYFTIGSDEYTCMVGGPVSQQWDMPQPQQQQQQLSYPQPQEFQGPSPEYIKDAIIKNNNHPICFPGGPTSTAWNGDPRICMGKQLYKPEDHGLQSAGPSYGSIPHAGGMQGMHQGMNQGSWNAPIHAGPWNAPMNTGFSMPPMNTGFNAPPMNTGFNAPTNAGFNFKGYPTSGYPSMGMGKSMMGGGSGPRMSKQSMERQLTRSLNSIARYEGRIASLEKKIDEQETRLAKITHPVEQENIEDLIDRWEFKLDQYETMLEQMEGRAEDLQDALASMREG